MTIQVTPEQKALHLCSGLAEIDRELEQIKYQIPPRSECVQVQDGEQSRTCRELEVEFCPRCETTEPLAQQWQKLKARRYSTLKKMRALGSSSQA